VELLLGARTDPLYGPLLVVGAGGIFVELLKDVSLRLLPVSRHDARAMLDELKIRPLLNGYRGSSPIECEPIIDAICGLSDLYLSYRHVIEDIEINPLIVRPHGQTPCAVDVRIIMKEV
jgi:succinyl-CoA synthetase beta subunit